MLENRDTSGGEADPGGTSAAALLETAVLQVLRTRGSPMTVKQVAAEVERNHDERASYTTVLTVLSRLVDRGGVRRSHDDQGYRYEAAIQDDPAVTDTHLLQRLHRFLRDEV